MNKKLLVLIYPLLISHAYAVGVKPENPTAVNDNVDIRAEVKGFNMASGVINQVNRETKVLTINQKDYPYSENTKVYDGQLANGKFIKYLLGEDSTITDIWVIK